MFYIAFYIDLPSKRKYNPGYKDYVLIEKSISKNKQFEFQIAKSNFCRVGGYIGWHRKQSHAGFNFSIDFLNLFLHIGIYDKRHWNYAKDRWCRLDDPECA